MQLRFQLKHFYDKGFLSRVFGVFSQIRWLFRLHRTFSVILLTSARTFELTTMEIDCAISTKLQML